jgi:hypothetical protein
MIHVKVYKPDSIFLHVATYYYERFNVPISSKCISEKDIAESYA